MKKNFLFSMMALVGMTFASCSQEEIVSTASNGQTGELITVSVNVPQVGVASRAMPEVEGHARRCILQLVGTDGAAIEDQRYVEAVTGETVSFTFTAPSDAYQCVFWADYLETADADVENAKDYIYDTSALPAVGYTGLSHTVHFSDAADAFCGVLANPTSGASITLKRPLTQIAIGTNTPSDYEGYTQVRVGNVGIPGGYNIFTQTVNTTTTKTTRLDLTTMEDAAAGQWTKLFVFASVDQTEYTFPEEFPLSVTISNGNADENKSQTLTSVNVDDNMISNINFTEQGGGEEPGGGDEPDDDMTINVSFGDKFDNEPVDPNAPLAVGDYVNANGEKVATVEEAVAVIFSLSEGVTDNSNYEGKTVKGYAIALENASNRTYLKNGSAGTWDSSLTATNDATNDYSGYTYSQALMASLEAQAESSILTSYNTWLGEHTTSGNLSTWYIPTYDQATAALSSVDPALAAALQEVRANGTWVLTSSVNADGTSIKGVLYTPTDATTGTVKEATIGTDGQAVIVPVVTIFE